jgi:UDP-N-acetylenolpyruvoylglucosamine reductase
MNQNLDITTGRDVLELIAMLKARVRETRGIELHTEVEIIGDEN